METGAVHVAARASLPATLLSCAKISARKDCFTKFNWLLPALTLMDRGATYI